MENSMKYLVILLCAAPFAASAVEVPIEGTVQSRCIIQTDTAGVYGNPNAYTLTTAPTDGGVLPIVRYDVSLADAYKAKITHPTSFSASPTLNDTQTWTGSTEVSAMSDAGMSGYEAAKVEYGNTTEFDLTVAGSTWFKTSSSATNGGDRAFPGGTYRAVVEAECIAK
jgi:hypothetical protein